MRKPSSNFASFTAQCGVIVIGAVLVLAGHLKANSGQSSKSQESPIAVHFTDVRKQAGITFLQDATATDEKYYLETMGTGVGWIDYDQDGLMDLFFVQSAATDIYKPPHPLQSARPGFIALPHQ